MLGAAILVCRSAYRAGAGYVRAVVPEQLRTPLTLAVPPVVTVERTTEGIERVLDRVDALVVGPGLGTGPDSARVIGSVFEYGRRPPLLLDADALNLLAPLDDGVRLGGSVVLTPHPGEAARLLGSTIHQVQDDREAAALELQRRSGAVVVLKGEGTVVVDGEQLFVNDTGNDGLGTAGSGDVLAGLIGALLASGQLGVFDAACLGVNLHGLAGERAAKRWSRRGLCADDLPDALAQVLCDLEGPAE